MKATDKTVDSCGNITGYSLTSGEKREDFTEKENKMSYVDKPDWQKSLEHHEELCTERYKSIHKELQFIREDMREMRTGQRWLIGIVLAWPPLIIAALQMIA